MELLGFLQQPLLLGGAKDLGSLVEIGWQSLNKKQMARYSRQVFMNKKKQKLHGNINDYPLVEVKWLDCLADNSWMSIDKAAKLEPAIAYSVGYKLLQTKSKVTIFADYTIDPEDQSITVGNTNTIPAAWVQEVTEITFK